MASAKLFLGCLALAIALVQSHPMKPKPKPCSKKCSCPDEFVDSYFMKIQVTVSSDYDWILNRYKSIEAKNSVPEYAELSNLFRELEEQKNSFDSCYSSVQSEIYERVSFYREQFSPFSIRYNERIAITRKTTRERMFPNLKSFRSTYYRIMRLLEDFYKKHQIKKQHRCRVLPRAPEYSFGLYFPDSDLTSEITGLIQTCWSDFAYLRDLINGINGDDDFKTRYLDEITEFWVDFNDHRLDIESGLYPKLLECKERELIDKLYRDYIRKLRKYINKFARHFFKCYGDIEDYYSSKSLTFQSFIDLDRISEDADIRGLYLPSNRLQDYFKKSIVTCRMDYLSAKRAWDRLDLKEGSSEWDARIKMLGELKIRLGKSETLINLKIRESFSTLADLYDKNPEGDFDSLYEKDIYGIIETCDRDMYPTIYEFREQFFEIDDFMDNIYKQRGIEDASRYVVSCFTPGYDATIMIADIDIRDKLSWFETLLSNNYYKPINDLVQLQLEKDSEEFRLKLAAMEKLEKDWFEYRNIINYVNRQLIDVIRKKNYQFGTPDYEREISVLREYCDKEIISVIDHFKRDCLDIDKLIGKLYKTPKCKKCKRSYVYEEKSFEFSFKSKTSKRHVKKC